MASKKKRTGGLQLPLFEPASQWRPPELSELPPSWAQAKRVAIDVETKDPDIQTLGCGARRPGCYMVGYSFAIEDGPRHYVPLRHQLGDNVPDAQRGLAYLRDNLKSYRGIVVGANIQYDLDFLAGEGIHMPEVQYVRDIQIADPLIYELHDRYSLKEIASRHGMDGKEEGLLNEAAAAYNVDPKTGLWQLPARYVGQYAEADAASPLRILRRQEILIDDMGLWDIYNTESQLTPILVKMRRRGVRVDLDRVLRIEDWSLGEEKRHLDEVKRLTGYDVGVGNVWQAERMAAPLREIGVTVPVNSQGASVDKDFLASIDHPVAKHLAQARKVNKLRTTFAQSIRRYMINGRIHCTFNQMARENEKGEQRGARYGRLSCEDPNLQQQPSRDEFAKEWRSIYLPEEGELWCSPDYSQQEPRWIVHYSALLNLPGAREAAQLYHDNPRLDSHQMMSDLSGQPRKVAKLIYLGLCYGEGGAKLCDDLRLPTRWCVSHGDWDNRVMEYFEHEVEARRRKIEVNGYCWRAAGEEGQRILDEFDLRVPFIRAVQKKAASRAKQTGYVITGGGRRLHFPQRADGDYDWTHKAFNRVIQGTGADQMKRAMVEVDRAGHHMLIQVHDELPCSVKEESEGQRIAAIMRDVMPALVPFKVDVEIGRSWGESMS